MKRISIVVVALMGALSLPVFAKGDANNGKNKSAGCIACHGIEGKVSVPLYPNLAGQNVLYLEHALLAYKKGERSGGQAEIMKAYVSGLSEQDIADLAAYYAEMKP